MLHRTLKSISFCCVAFVRHACFPALHADSRGRHTMPLTSTSNTRPHTQASSKPAGKKIDAASFFGAKAMSAQVAKAKEATAKEAATTKVEYTPLLLLCASPPPRRHPSLLHGQRHTARDRLDGASLCSSLLSHSRCHDHRQRRARHRQSRQARAKTPTERRS